MSFTLAGLFFLAKNRKNKVAIEKSKIAIFNRKVLRYFGKKCDICGSKKDVEVHHTWDKSTYPEKRFIVRLGRPLCKVHHKTGNKEIPSFHMWMGGTKVSCTMKDYKLYKQMILNDMKFKTKHDYLEHLRNVKSFSYEGILIFFIVVVISIKILGE